MADDPVVLETMAAVPDETGETIRFRIKGADGREVDVACRHDLVENVIRFLIETAREAAVRRTAGIRTSFARAEQVEVDPLPISHATFMAEPETSEIVLLLRMFGFDLGFSLTPEHLAALKKELERIVPAVAPPDHHHDHDHHH